MTISGIERDVAVGVSGGADSMALAHKLSVAATATGVRVHALIVDHGLRADSATEARAVFTQIAQWPHITPIILRWDHNDRAVATRLQEQARAARYGLMAAYCREHGIADLYLAHHADDQGETFLMRLCAGSGLDGLGCMRETERYDDTLCLRRPLLAATHQELVDYCRLYRLEWVEDPSNADDRFERVRMRKLAEALAGEGLTNARLARTALRLRRARDAIDAWVDQIWADPRIRIKDDGIVFPRTLWDTLPDEIAFRLLQRAVRAQGPDRPYHARMKNLEDLFARVRSDPDFSAATLAGVIVRRLPTSISVATEGPGGSPMETFRQRN